MELSVRLQRSTDRRTIKVDVNNTNLLEVLENEGVKTYGNSVFVDIGFQTAIDRNENLECKIKKFVNRSGKCSVS